MANPLSSFADAQSLIPPAALKSQLSRIPAYRSNRERAAVIFRQGLAAYDTYVKTRPWIFAASLVGAGVCSWGLWKRKGAEAKGLYGVGLVTCLATAWLTRPPAPAPAAPAKPGVPAKPAPAGGIVAAIDAKRAEYTAKDPRWADKVMAGVAALPGVREEVAAAPVLKAILG
jgi:hypothetical protein